MDLQRQARDTTELSLQISGYNKSICVFHQGFEFEKKKKKKL